MKGNIKPFAALSSLYCQDNQITAELPYRPTWPTQEEITIVPVNSEATVSTPTTTDGGKTWTFTVTSKDGPSSQAYTISVTILPHVHEWEKTWTWNETPHWYGCASAICPGIQEDAEKAAAACTFMTSRLPHRNT